MSDHAVVLAAAIRGAGGKAEMLPPSDEKTLELGRKYSSGKECHPFIVTAGDFTKKMEEPGFDPDTSAFFMPSASGPCRFGNYHKAHKIIFERLGYKNIAILSPHAKDSYSKSMGLNLTFRLNAWHGGIATDLLQKLTWQTRPYEKHKGETDRAHALFLDKIADAIEHGNGRIFKAVQEMKEAYAGIPLSINGEKPVIGIVGEIYLRCNPENNADIIRRIEALGAEAWVAPIMEWGYYTTHNYIWQSLRDKDLYNLSTSLLQDLVQKRIEHRLSHRFKGLIRNLAEPPTKKVINYSAPYLHHSFRGEAVLSLGKAIDYIHKGASGIINVMPFTCMPGTIVSALAKRMKENYPDIPWLDLSIDGNEGVNLDTRLEAFVYQAKSRQATHY
jgi:predicted nucleotide-binding protein (sugar kinase/HSP70/actin superfamily)